MEQPFKCSNRSQPSEELQQSSSHHEQVRQDCQFLNARLLLAPQRELVAVELRLISVHGHSLPLVGAPTVGVVERAASRGMVEGCVLWERLQLGGKYADLEQLRLVLAKQ